MLFSASGTYFVVALISAAASYVIAHRKGLNAPGWAWGSLFLVFPVVILPFVRSRRAPPPPELDDRWQSLSLYEPEIKAAVSQLSPLGQPAIEEFRRTYGQVQHKEAIPNIVADIERRWATYASAGWTHVETKDGVDVMRDEGGTYHVGGRQTADLKTARLIASVNAKQKGSTKAPS